MSTSTLTFEVLWYAGGPDHAPNRVIGRDYVKRHDLTDAITAACNMLKAGKGNSDYAHGFYVRSVKAEKQPGESTEDYRRRASTHR